ncbi:MAG TPA: hypothetical protein VL400_24040, partial [Polyangiaceae bacterium]|nr:hypothetical protein [Polyangiaceae bacterium]
MDDRPSLLPERLSALPQRITLILKPRRFRKYAGYFAAALGLSAVFVASAGAGLVLHLGSGPARRVTQRVVNDALSPVFRGRIVVGEIEGLSLGHARIREAWCYGPDGDETIHAEGIDADVNPMRLLRSLGGERTDPVLILLPRVRIEHAEVSLQVDEAGIPSIANGFMPKASGPPSPIPAKPVVVAMPRVEIDEASARGNVGIPLDARLRKLSANIFVRTDEVIAVDVDRTGIAERAILPAPIRGVATYSLRFDVRSDEARRGDAERHDRMRMWATLDGSVGTVPVSARAIMEGLELAGSLDLPQASPEGLKGIFAWMPVEREVKGRIKAIGHLPDLALTGTFEVPQGSGVGTILAEGDIGARHGVAFDLRLAAAELDPRALFSFAPDMRVSGRSFVRVRLPPSGIADVSLEVATEPTWAFGQRVPAADAVFHLVDGAMLGSIALQEEGFPIDGRLTIEDGAIAFSVVGSGDDLSQNARMRGVLGGRGNVRVDGTFKDGAVDADIAAKGSGLAVLGGPESGFSATTGDVTAHVKGAIGALTVEGNAHAAGVRVRDEDLDDVSVRVSGPVLEPTLVASVRDDARGVFSGTGTVSIPGRAAKNVTFSLER